MDEDVLKGLKLFENNYSLRTKILFLMEEWKKMCPSVDVKNQVAWAHYWLLSNPRKMKKDLARFLANWMKSEEKRNLERRQGERRTLAPLPPPKYYDTPDEELPGPEEFQKMKEALKRK